MNNYKSCLYAFDLLGIKPELKIFNNNSYKSVLSSFITIIIFLICIAFSIYSIIIYCKFDNPSVIYYKDNDKITNRTLLLKDTLLMFKYIYRSKLKPEIISGPFFEATYINIYYNGTYNSKKLNIEICELGKNIDIKYKDLIKEIEINVNPINEFYCISDIHENLSLSYIPGISYSNIYLYFLIKNDSNFIIDELQPLIISENGIINHNNKENPIIKSYSIQLAPSFSSNEYTEIDYNFQYIKYETDNGLIFQTSQTIEGKSFSDINNYKYLKEDYNLLNNSQYSDNVTIGEIIFNLNKSSFDHYKRIFPKVQSLITEIMAVVNLLFGIAEKIFNILLPKKMSKDIVQFLLEKNDNHKHQSLDQNNKIHNKLYKEIGKSKTSSEIKIDINSERQKDNQAKLNEEMKINQKIIKKDIKKINTGIIKNLNYWNIIKSYLCFKDKKTKLINICHSLIINDMSIEKIIKRLYNIEKIYLNIYKDNKLKHKYKGDINNNSLKEIKKFIYQMTYEISNK